jgi:Kef-type K+ transport system membrane component KefB
MSVAATAWIVVKASIFLFGALALGVAFSPRLFSSAARLQTSGVLLAVALAFCFLLAWIAHEIGLAPIVGAFAAGLVLEESHSRAFVERGERDLDDRLEELTSVLGPVFFVVAGARTDLSAFLHTDVLGLAAALTAAAIAGKQASGLGAAGGGRDWISVGAGMIPRGEVGLIFANIGLTLRIGGRPVIDEGIFSAIVMMIIVTTLVTPPALTRTFARSYGARGHAA